MASLAGAWTALVAGFGGMRAEQGRLSFAPRLPAGIGRLTFRVLYRGSTLVVRTDGDSATYRVRSGPPLEIAHHGEPIEVGEEPVERTRSSRCRPAPGPTSRRGGSRNGAVTRLRDCADRARHRGHRGP